MLLVPAMNREMWNHPFTRRNVREILEQGEGRYQVVEPAVKELACGEIGPGGFPEVEDVARRILELP